MAHYKFHRDIKDGVAAEEIVLEIIQAEFPKSYRVVGKESRWDLIVVNEQGEESTVEVKNDLMAPKTGNIAIETRRKNGTLTGINITESEFWFHKVADSFYVFTPKKMREFISSKSFREVWGGDSWNTAMCLVPIKELEQQEWIIKLTLT